MVEFCGLIFIMVKLFMFFFSEFLKDLIDGILGCRSMGVEYFEVCG